MYGHFRFFVCGWNPSEWPFKWKLLSSTFMWHCSLCWTSGFHFLLCEKTQCVTIQTIVLVEMTKNDNLVNSHYQIERYPASFCRNLPVERAVYSPADKDWQPFLITMQLQWIPRRTGWSRRWEHNQAPSSPQDGTRISNCQEVQHDLHIW